MEKLQLNNFESSVGSKEVCLVKFYADWCVPCKKLQPILDEVSSEKGVPLVSVDVDESPELASMYAVRALPTVILLRNGQVSGEPIVGAKTKSVYEQLISTPTE